MNNDAIKEAKQEAKRFLRRIEDYEANPSACVWNKPKESGALRRSSMDLTRALAKMRQSQ